MDIVAGTKEQLTDSIYQEVLQYRYRVFIERLGWDLPAKDHRDRDQFDREDTHYVVARDQQQRVIGCARLLPTDRPYLLEEVFPQLLNGHAPPKTSRVWEISRFASVNLSKVATRTSQAEITRNILDSALQFLRKRGAEAALTVSPLAIERLLRQMNVPAQRLGPPALIDGAPVIACLITIAC